MCNERVVWHLMMKLGKICPWREQDEIVTDF